MVKYNSKGGKDCISLIKHMPKKIKIKDIAKKVGCSQATVSQAFNNPKLINRQTRAKILAVSAELGYVRQRFNKKREKIIGITGLSQELILGEYYNKITAAIISAAKVLGVNVIIESFSDKEIELPSMFSKKVLDGVIILGKISQEHILMIKQNNFPLVLCGHPVPGLELHTVLSDGRSGIFEATKHLIQLGHQKIAYIAGGPLFDPVTSDRLDGFRYALNEKNIPIPEDYIQISDFCALAKTQQAIENLIKIKPTAIVCENDSLAYTTYHLLSQAGLNIPLDISLSGFDDLPFPEYLQPIKPNLTTVHVDLEELGKITLNVLLEIIENPTDIAHRHTIPVKLKIGGTTLPPR